MSIVYCPECGFQNPEAANYCAKCGALLTTDEVGAETTQIVPDACENSLDLCRRFLRKCGGQISTTDLLLPHHRSD